MTLSFLGFTLIYAPHGAFTGLAHRNIWLFLLYGPASRLVMAILLLIALLSLYHPPDAVVQRARLRPWLTWIGLFLLADLAVAYCQWQSNIPHFGQSKFPQVNQVISRHGSGQAPCGGVRVWL
jgi:hypothetical protein